MSFLEVLIRTTFQTFSNGSKYSSASSKLPTRTDHTNLIEVLEQFTAKDVSVHESMMFVRKPPTVRRAPVTYIDVFDHALFTVGVFILHPNAVIPLHDHPGMLGFIKVLCGEIKLTSYTKLKKLSTSDHLVVCEESQILNSLSPPTILTPHERNFHQLEFAKGESEEHQYAAFLDILSPPYNSFSGKPECNYYYPTKYSQPSDQDECASKPLLELVKHSCPREFWNDAAPYLGPNRKQIAEKLKKL